MSDNRPEVQIVKCEQHGLRYNAAIQNGCARCRREGGKPKARKGAASSSNATPTLLMTAALIFGTSGGLFMAHQAATDAFVKAFAFGGPGFFEDTGEVDSHEDLFGSAGQPIDFCDQIDDPNAMLSREERRTYRELCKEPNFLDP